MNESEWMIKQLESTGVLEPSPAESSSILSPVLPPLPEWIGRYRVEKVVGRGGFGVVYLAHDEQLQRLVAIKVPHAGLVADAAHAEAYLTEARAVASLDHPNIVPVHDIGSTKQFPCYLVAKYIDGTDLATHLKTSRLRQHEIVELVATVAEALHHAHKHGLVHRDIKPGNILLDNNGRPFVTDFGLALREQDVGKGPRFAGTPAYMSPEQARGEGHRVDGRSDIFSLGVVFYELLVGRQPFRADRQADLLDQIRSLDPPPPRQFDDSIPKELERICLKALSKRASDRYSTALEMAEDLKHFQTFPQPEATSRSWSSGLHLNAPGTLSKLSLSSDQRVKVIRSTFVFADFKGYTERVRILESTAGHQAAAEMRRQVAHFIEEAFRQLESEIKSADYELIATAGDGFFFHFRLATNAFRFAEVLSQITTARNAHVTEEIAEHWFRIGAATGDAAWDDGEPVGHVVNTSSRLQAASTGGDFVIDQATYDDLPPEIQKQFGPKEVIRDKHDKTFDVYRTAFGRVLSPLPVTVTTPSSTTAPAFRSTSSSTNLPIRIVPKGLRSFDAHDADFFLELLPGPRDRDGLPDSIRFWKTRIEETDADNTFSVGLLYGPSGCGKSSLVKAGLLPRLSKTVIAVYVEATAGETETRLLNGLRKRCPALSENLGLKETLAAIRQGQGTPAGKKVLIVLDQFEQWLHARKDEQNTELVQALRQCDGVRVQCVVMVRDDFWMAATRLMRELEIRLSEGHNSAAVDLFPVRHAEHVLAAFGRAFGVLPERSSDLSKDQKEFLKDAVSGLAEEGKVISVRLALFAEMMKAKSWTPVTLKEVGGTKGVGVTFLEETFSAVTAPPEHRYHVKATRAVLKALLPESGTNIKGHMRSYAELLEASGYVGRPKDFDDLLRILDAEIRLITPTDPEGQAGAEESTSNVRPRQKYYQLAHDYLVPSLREWLTRRQKETRHGRAELLLADRAGVWNARPENRQLPSFLQWVSIWWLTTRKNWSTTQWKMMWKANRYHARRGAILASCLALLVLVGWESFGRLQARTLRDRLLESATAEAPSIVKDMASYRRWVNPLLREAYAQAEQKHDRRKQLHTSLALLPVDASQVEYLSGRLLTAEPHEVLVIREALFDNKAALTEQLWSLLENPKHDQDQRFRAACALATFAPDDARWGNASGDVAATLVIQKPFEIARWTEALKGVGRWLILPLADFLVDENRSVSERGLIASVYGTYATDTPDAYSRLEKQLAETSEPDATVVTKVALAKKQASIGTALLIMDQREKVWPLLKHQPDPTLRSFLIERLAPAGVDPKVLLARLVEEKEVSGKRAILLSLGQFGLDHLSVTERRNQFPHILQLYRDDLDPGIHGASEWLLRLWQASDEIKEIDKGLATGNVEGQRQWYLNRQGQTMVVISKPGEFWMGEGEDRHRVRIDRSFALASKEVTVDQFLRFRKEHEYVKPYAPTSDCPVNQVAWYDAAAYCNWLSAQEGIPKEQWCYVPNQEGKYEDGMTMAPDYLRRTGYRLPTEAEWEYSCRAGTESDYSFGQAEELLGEYGWYDETSRGKSHPVGTLKANNLGLFDMHGNDWEWCQDVYREYAMMPGNTARIDSEEVTVIDPEARRVLRSSAFYYPAPKVRSATRNLNEPANRSSLNGFRPARTQSQ